MATSLKLKTKNGKTTNNKTDLSGTSTAGKRDFSTLSKARALNELLATEYSLFTKTLNYHWNITGPRFHSIHGFLETQYNALLKIIDSIAERNRKLGHNAIGTMSEFIDLSLIREKKADYPMTNVMIDNLVNDHQIVINLITKMLKSHDFETDLGTEDFLVSLIREHEEMLWMLRSHLDQ